MSVTRDLASGGELSRLLVNHLTDLHKARSTWGDAIRDRDTVNYVADDFAALGSNVEYAIGLDIATRVPYRFLLDGYPRDTMIELVSAAGFVSPSDDAELDWGQWRKIPGWKGADTQQGQTLVRLTGVIVAWEELVRLKHWERAPMRAFLREWWDKEIARRRNPYDNAHWLVMPIWEAYTQHLRSRLLNLGSAHAGVEFYEGFGVADLICGTTLLDVKTCQQLGEDCTEWIRQLAAYFLLDTDNTYNIDTLGIVLPRQSTLVAWPIEDIFTPQTLDSLPQIRQEAKRIVHATQAEIASR